MAIISGNSSRSSCFGAASPVNTKSAARICSPRFNRSEAWRATTFLPLVAQHDRRGGPIGAGYRFCPNSSGAQSIGKYELVRPCFHPFILCVRECPCVFYRDRLVPHQRVELASLRDGPLGSRTRGRRRRLIGNLRSPIFEPSRGLSGYLPASRRRDRHSSLPRLSTGISCSMGGRPKCLLKKR